VNFAAIDIGSNAIRLLFVNVTTYKEETHFHKISLTRSPVRLGSDTFLNNHISDDKKEDLIKTLIAYRNLIEVYKVQDYLCYATSAMRDASNGLEVAKEASERSGVPVHVISGEQEAKTIFSIHAAEDIDPEGAYLYIDVGGGSAELTFINKGKHVASESFKTGTIRILENIVQESEWTRMNKWLHTYTFGHKKLEAIGTGGNINKIFKFTNTDEGKPVSYQKLKDCQEFLSNYTYEQRVSILGLREDRADVIVPACNIYLHIMNEANIKKIYVPKVGLADGMIHLMWDKYKNQN
jgi:exopolyphosphatase/guanosine-5'-triphosphate,3'-diphosphate pyrophosphatase